MGSGDVSTDITGVIEAMSSDLLCGIVTFLVSRLLVQRTFRQYYPPFLTYGIATI